METDLTRLCDPDAVSTAQAAQLASADLAELVEIFGLLADPTRAQLVQALIAVDELCVGDLARACDVSETVVSHSLRRLRSAGIVQGTRRGRRVHYRIDDGHSAHRVIVAMKQLTLSALPTVGHS